MLSSMWAETFWTSNLFFKREILFFNRAIMATWIFQLMPVISRAQIHAMRENYYFFGWSIGFVDLSPMKKVFSKLYSFQCALKGLTTFLMIPIISFISTLDPERSISIGIYLSCGWTQNNIAAICNVSFTTVRRWSIAYSLGITLWKESSLHYLVVPTF